MSTELCKINYHERLTKAQSFIVKLQVLLFFVVFFVLFLFFNDNNFIVPFRLVRKGRGHSDETVLMYQKGKNLLQFLSVSPLISDKITS